MRRATNVSYESGSFWIDPRIAASLPLDRVWRGQAIGIVVETKGPLLVVFVIAPLCFSLKNKCHSRNWIEKFEGTELNEETELFIHVQDTYDKKLT